MQARARIGGLEELERARSDLAPDGTTSVDHGEIGGGRAQHERIRPRGIVDPPELDVDETSTVDHPGSLDDDGHVADRDRVPDGLRIGHPALIGDLEHHDHTGQQDGQTADEGQQQQGAGLHRRQDTSEPAEGDVTPTAAPGSHRSAWVRLVNDRETAGHVGSVEQMQATVGVVLSPRRRNMVALIATGALVVAGCGSDDGGAQPGATAVDRTTELDRATEPTDGAVDPSEDDGSPADDDAEAAAEPPVDDDDVSGDGSHGEAAANVGDTAGTVPSDAAAGAAAPEILQVSAPLIGGGELDLATVADRPVLLWFWSPF